MKFEGLPLIIMRKPFPILMPSVFQNAMLSLVIVLIVGACVMTTSQILAENNTSALADENFVKGLEYFWAEDIPQHYEEAFVWLSKAVEYGHPWAQAMQADMLANGLGSSMRNRGNILRLFVGISWRHSADMILV